MAERPTLVELLCLDRELFEIHAYDPDDPTCGGCPMCAEVAASHWDGELPFVCTARAELFRVEPGEEACGEYHWALAQARCFWRLHDEGEAADAALDASREAAWDE